MLRLSKRPTLITRFEQEPRILELRLLLTAALFMVVFALALSLSPAGRVRAWTADWRWEHWIGVAVWLGVFAAAHWQANRRLPGRDPYLLPGAALITGWGLLTIYRLAPGFGLRQSVWLAISGAALIAGMRLPGDLGPLRRYKYLWMTGALLLTATTLLLGVNPLGFGPRMWLGCCGVYLQPSEPLKLLLIAYLAAAMAGLQPFLMLEDRVIESGSRANRWLRRFSGPLRAWMRLAPLLAPTLVMTGLALAILLVQRDLGTAAIFLFLYAAIVYLASCRRSVLVVAVLGMAVAGWLGYQLFDVVRVRVDAWINPWLDPAGRSYQIVQSIIAIANGGTIGRGPGMGSPVLVPLAHSDLIFAALAEETGLLGVIGLLTLIGLLAVRGLRAAMLARSPYHRYLAAGLVALLAGQSLLIIGGNLRLLPLTGVTLPFISYGGSSLLTSFVCLLLLIHVSDRGGEPAAALYRPTPYIELGTVLLGGLLACGLVTGWWAVVRNSDLLTRTDNQRRYIADRYVRRGAILDRSNRPIAVSEGEPGEMVRRMAYPDLSNVVGYTDPTYGQAGIEAGLDPYLRGLRGHPGLEVWWDHLLYGQPPPGLDIRLSLDLDLQQQADAALNGHAGALAAVNAFTGEILALASHPTFDANRLAEEYNTLIADPDGPLFNRAVLGRYPADELAAALFPEGAALMGPNPLTVLQLPLNGETTANLAAADRDYSPLQVAMAAAALVNGGVRPAPQLVTAVQTPQAGWMPLEPATAAETVLPAETARERIRPAALAGRQVWVTTSVVALEDEQRGAWAVAGTLPAWPGTPYAVVVFVEEDHPELAASAALELLERMMGPPTP